MRFCHLFVSALALFVMLACTSRGGKKEAASSATAATLPPGCVDSFRVLADGYAADDSSGYFEGRPFRAQFPHTLAAVGGGYAKDRFSAYYRGREIATAQAGTFRHEGGDTARDQLDVYIKGVKQYSR